MPIFPIWQTLIHPQALVPGSPAEGHTVQMVALCHVGVCILGEGALAIHACCHRHVLNITIKGWVLLDQVGPHTACFGQLRGAAPHIGHDDRVLRGRTAAQAFRAYVARATRSPRCSAAHPCAKAVVRMSVLSVDTRLAQYGQHVLRIGSAMLDTRTVQQPLRTRSLGFS